MEEFTKGCFIRMTKVGTAVNYMPMEICILGILHKTKSMGKAPSIGLVFALLPVLNKQMQRYNNIMVIGGEDYPMAKDNIKSQMVIFVYNLGDFYIGGFKNGLKHGDGV
jgi:hypothetical protein